MYTNGEVIKVGVDAGELRKYRLVTIDGLYAWVEALNGSYKGERLTFRRCDLRKILNATS